VDARAPRRIDVDMESLAGAFEASSWDVSTYLDLASGEIISIGADVWRELEALSEHLPTEQVPGDTSSTAFTAALEQTGLLSWMREALIDAHAVKHGLGSRYLEVPPGGGAEGYEDMTRFIETVPNARLQLRLRVAIRGDDGFGRFKAVLAGEADERARWYRFKEERLRERALQWLTAQGIEPVADS
jgi:hypothetical protein